MTGPITTEALVEALNAAIELQRCLAPLDQIHWSAEDPSVCLRLFRETETQAVIGLMKAVRAFEDTASLAPLLDALQQVTAERDAEREAHAVSARERNLFASELARLRAEGEAKDRALKEKAEGQVSYWRERQRAEKSLEDGVSEDGQTYTPIGDEAAWQAGYCNGRMSEADWWGETFQYWPDEAARAATAREGAPQSVLRHLSDEERQARATALGEARQQEIAAALNREEADRG